MKSIFIFSDNQKDSISYFERETAIVVTMDRNDLPYLKVQDFSNFPAIYVLIGGNKRYIGQAGGQSIATRLSQHFQGHDKDWVKAILFFSREGGKMSKADTDYLERRLIQDFKMKSDYDLTNSTIGNNGYIGKLQKAQSDQLYERVFEIINDIANIDMFGVIEDSNAIESTEDMNFKLSYDGKSISSKSARGLFVSFAKELVADKKYTTQIERLIIDDDPTSALFLGRKLSNYNGKPNSAEVGPGIWLYTNFSRKDTKAKIEKLATQLSIKINLKWS